MFPDFICDKMRLTETFSITVESGISMKQWMKKEYSTSISLQIYNGSSAASGRTILIIISRPAKRNGVCLDCRVIWRIEDEYEN